MFTGIVRGVGRIVEQADLGGDRRLTVATGGVDLPGLKEGDSVAVNGACLTVIDPSEQGFSADVSLETLAVTTLGGLPIGAPVNLEPALRLGESLDGHLLTGHVDGVGRVAAVTPSARSTVISVEVPAELEPYVARKGAVAVDGVSLTVNSLEDGAFSVNVVPHTLEKTIIPDYRPGATVNIEVDIIARYLERLTNGRTVAAGVGMELLEAHGYTNKN